MGLGPPVTLLLVHQTRPRRPTRAAVWRCSDQVVSLATTGRLVKAAPIFTLVRSFLLLSQLRGLNVQLYNPSPLGGHDVISDQCVLSSVYCLTL